MDVSQFEKLVNKEKYQIFLFVCPAVIPFNLAKHPWFVVNRKGVISRWEIFWKPKKWKTSWGHLHQNFYSPFQGIAKFFFSEKYLWHKVKLLSKIEGDENSLAVRMADFIEVSPEVYPYCYRFFLAGPNSNTYAQWILNNFSEFKVELPWSAFGNNYKTK